MKLSEAEELVTRLTHILSVSVERLEVAGSVRRRKPEPKDLEIVCLPKWETHPMIFGVPDQVNLLDEQLHLLERDGVLGTRPDRNGRRAPFGPRYYRLTYGGQPVDLFAVLPPAEWGVIFTIRTGPEEYSIRLVTEALRRGMKVKDGQLWICANGEPTTTIPCPEESNFLSALGSVYREPWERS